MATSIIFRSLTRRGLCTSSSSALCSKCHALIEDKSKTTVAKPTKLVFNFKSPYDNRKVRRCQIPKIIESPNGDITMYDIIVRNNVAAERARGLRVTKVAVHVPPYINEFQKQIIMEAANDAGVHIERFITDEAENPFLDGTDADKGGFAIVIGLVEVFDVPIKEIILSGDKPVSETILSELQKIRGYDLKEDPAMVQKIKEAVVDRAMELMSSSNLKKTGIKLNLPVEPAESTTITWSID
ncbi:hypothetical protein MKW98_007199 [Papaver atlanticum]|uniref:Uncharacterized protein n=1 Tax=Papaver atlanticum TaxID=357466 RepID=A0AAD4SMF2_9MAGN|nr:hypothetical protein MKW98_007199 [Papaver atlanticum]